MSDETPDLPFIEFNGERRYLANFPTPAGTVMAPMAREVMPRSEWREFDDTLLADYGPKIKDQNGKGACNGHAAATSLEGARWAAGLTYFDLSAWYVYAILCNGRDTGSNIGQALAQLGDDGTCLDSSLAYGTINPRIISSAARAEAKNFKIEIGSMLPTFDDIMTSVQLRRFGNFSLYVGGQFNNLSSEGVIPVQRGPGNHAITFVPAAKKLKNGRWAFKMQNSWTKAWGLKGFGWVVEEHIANQSYFEAYEIAAPTESTTDKPFPNLTL